MQQEQSQQQQAVEQLELEDADGAESVNYYPEHIGHGGAEELSLDMLKDSPPGQKPLYPFSTLIRCAIKGSPTGKLLLEDIYYCLEKRFEYFRTVPPGWKNTIRHTLSLHPSFEKVPRPLTDRGKGCYWTVNDVVDPRIGVQRVRKKKEGIPGKRGQRGRPPSNPQAAAEAAGWYDPAMAAAAAVPRVPGQFGYTQFDANGNPYPIQIPPQYALFLAEDAYEPEISPDGQPDWHAIWKNELRRLRHATIEQMRAGAGPDWFKMMAETVRNAFMIPVQPPTGEEGQPQLGPNGEPVDPSTQVMVDNNQAGVVGQPEEAMAQQQMM